MCYTHSNKSKDDDFGLFLGTLVQKRKKNKVPPGIYLHLYIIDGVSVVPSQNSEDRPEGPFWGP